MDEGEAGAEGDDDEAPSLVRLDGVVGVGVGIASGGPSKV